MNATEFAAWVAAARENVATWDADDFEQFARECIFRAEMTTRPRRDPMRRALSAIANASAGDMLRGESDADYWRRFARELQADARRALNGEG